MGLEYGDFQNKLKDLETYAKSYRQSTEGIVTTAAKAVGKFIGTAISKVSSCVPGGK